ncbi:MAG TPA: hypothetical protein VNU25_03385 [Candidatus Paceibacterota bacterium]|nr:hypothetical protein [Candidatus Paceibacterota bacterium]
MQDPAVQPFTVLDFIRFIDVGKAVSVAFAILFIIWALYTVIAGYHWLRYGHSSAVAIPALIVHVVVSWLLAGYAVSGIIG